MERISSGTKIRKEDKAKMKNLENTLEGKLTGKISKVIDGEFSGKIKYEDKEVSIRTVAENLKYLSPKDDDCRFYALAFEREFFCAFYRLDCDNEEDSPQTIRENRKKYLAQIKKEINELCNAQKVGGPIHPHPPAIKEPEPKEDTLTNKVITEKPIKHKIISGQLVDSKNNGVPNKKILILDTREEGITDANGSFSIKTKKEKGLLTISYPTPDSTKHETINVSQSSLPLILKFH
ncbi:MAG: hypothetical protein AAF573_10730 [Bacteroidota bacterium]